MLTEVFGAQDFELPKKPMYDALRTTVFRAHQRGWLESDATTDNALLDVAATIEHRALEAKPGKRAKKADDTEEVLPTLLDLTGAEVAALVERGVCR